MELSRSLSGKCWRFRTTDLEYGLYWFRDAERCVKYIPGRSIYKEYYDPAKPVLLYIHGWERTSVNFQKEKLKDFIIQSFFHFAGDLDKSMKAPVDLVSIWKKKYLNHEQREGNFGILYWNQFSDDDHGFAKPPENVESKTWTSGGPAGMRYAVRKQSRKIGKWHTGSYFSEKHSPDKPVSILLADIIKTALAVTDPYWCKARKTCWSTEHSAYWGHKHVNSLLCYFWQYAFPPPVTGFSAASTNAEIADRMNYRHQVKFRYSQIRGMDRASPEQNDFEELRNSW